MSAFKYLPELLKTAALAVSALVVMTAFAAPPYTSTTGYSAVSPNISSSSGAKPMMMIATSKDHTLFGPIYTDFEDLEGDGKINTTFQPTFKYYGYFDPAKCYVYQDSRFEPSVLATAAPPATTAPAEARLPLLQKAYQPLLLAPTDQAHLPQEWLSVA